MTVEPRSRDRSASRTVCPRGHQMQLHQVELPPRQVVRRGGIGGWELGIRYKQYVCDTCGHRGIPLPALG
jgi:hypothetical protein